MSRSPGPQFFERAALAALTDASNAAPQFCRIVSWTDERVNFHEIHRYPDGTEREPRVEPWNVPIRSFFTYDLGRCHDGPLPPVSRSYGVDVPMNPKKQGAAGPAGREGSTAAPVARRARTATRRPRRPGGLAVRPR